MEDLTKLYMLMTDAKKISMSIIRKSLVSMKNLKHKDSDFFKYISESKNTTEGGASHIISKDELKKLAEEASLKMINDAEIVIKEIDAFASALVMNKNIDECGSEFMLSVWHGDVYDKTNLEGLAELVADLNDQYQKCGPERIIELMS